MWDNAVTLSCNHALTRYVTHEGSPQLLTLWHGSCSLRSEVGGWGTGFAPQIWGRGLPWDNPGLWKASKNTNPVRTEAAGIRGQRRDPKSNLIPGSLGTNRRAGYRLPV
ncbi:hypothetical protein JZ751_021268 [Albula glossodonta]|uniref:Uncharacterized protein n=1 Tax=Albula glossodonta TaxID=121402 RepID=A0A8T2NKX4_9TELE|nr:hypothetical protein JZ751_021268 [Albula glossodonta]